MTRLNSSGLIFMNGANTEVNASLTQMSIGPSSASTSSAAVKTASGSAMSTGTVMAVPPRSRTSSAAAFSPFLPRASSATLAPRMPYRRATARPTPPLAPVTTTTWSRARVPMLRSCPERAAPNRGGGDYRAATTGTHFQHWRNRESLRRLGDLAVRRTGRSGQ